MLCPKINKQTKIFHLGKINNDLPPLTARRRNLLEIQKGFSTLPQFLVYLDRKEFRRLPQLLVPRIAYPKQAKISTVLKHLKKKDFNTNKHKTSLIWCQCNIFSENFQI